MTNRRIIIHIGFPRCGSTLLQRELFPRLGGKIRVMSPASSDRRLVNFLINKFILTGRNIYLTPVTTDEKQYIDLLLSEYPEPILLISCEGLVGDSFDNMLPSPHLLEALKVLFGEPEIMLVIRRQSDLVQSYYRYAVEEGHYGSYPRFVGYFNGGFLGFRLRRYADTTVDPLALNYRNFLQFLEARFGRGRVHVIPFEWIARDFPRFCGRLAEITGTPFLPGAGPAPVVNRGAQAGELILLKALNRLWDTRLLGVPVFPNRPFIESLDRVYRPGRWLIRIVRGISARMCPAGAFRVLRPVFGPILNIFCAALAITGLSCAAEIEVAIRKASNASNLDLNRQVGGLLNGLGYCENE